MYDQTEVVNYGSTAHHDQEEPLMQTPAPAPAGYTSLNDLKSPDSKRYVLPDSAGRTSKSWHTNPRRHLSRSDAGHARTPAHLYYVASPGHC